MSHPAVFLDRDETIIDDPGFIDRPDQVRLQPGAAAAIGRFRNLGYKVIVVSNQSGVARGLISEEQLSAVHARLRQLLKERGVPLDAVYYCPYLDGPEAVVEAYRKDSDLRKPKPGMLLQAADELGIDLSSSWMIGDRPSDVEAGQRAGCRTVLLTLGRQAKDNGSANPSFRAETLVEAASIVAENASKPSTQTRPKQQGGPEPDVAGVLTEIRDLLDRQRRMETQDDFSLLRLFGTFCQMLAAVLVVWGIFALSEAAVAATPRFALAIFFQLVTITTIIVDRRR